MNRLYLVVFLLFLSNLFISCEKSEKEENVVVIDTNTINTTFITVGDTNNMEVTSIDSFITAYSTTNNRIKLDIDHDGVNDFELTNFDNQGPQMTWYITAKLISLDSNSFILGNIVTDTLFKEVTTTITTQPNNQVFFSQSSNIRCSQVTPSYTVNQIRNNFRLKPLIKNEFFNFTDSFKTGSFEFWEQSSNYFTNYQNPDTVFNYSYSQYRCFALPFQVPIYLGFRINKTPQPKYGWIKLINDYSSLIILETAMQK